MVRSQCSPVTVADRKAPFVVRCPNATQRAPRRLGIPPIVHFVYGLEPNASFSWTSFVAVRSALAVHRPSTAFFHYSFEPPGVWFAAVRSAPPPPSPPPERSKKERVGRACGRGGTPTGEHWLVSDI
jgi:hypothetical protein